MARQFRARERQQQERRQSYRYTRSEYSYYHDRGQYQQRAGSGQETASSGYSRLTPEVKLALQILGIQQAETATLAEVKAGYKLKAFETHPDRCPQHLRKLQEAKFKALSAAYELVLKEHFQVS